MTEYSKVHFTQAIAEDRAARARQGAAPKFGASGSNVVSITAAADQIGMDERPTPPLDAYGDWGGADFDEHNSAPVEQDGGFFIASKLEGKPVPARKWLVEGLVPSGTVTLLGGDGGTGKSLLALQLAIASALGNGWLGHSVTAGHAVYLSAEDDEDELHRRADDVAQAAGATLGDLDKLHLRSLAGKDALLALQLTPTGPLQATGLYNQRWLRKSEQPG